MTNIAIDHDAWPTDNLGAMPQNGSSVEVVWPQVSPQGLVTGNITEEHNTVINPEKYSASDKLWKIMYFVFKFVNKCRKIEISESNLKIKSYLFLMKMMKLECFPDELKPLQTAELRIILLLISKYNLFLDKN